MKFREIDESIRELITEDGEILDVEAFDALNLERNKKIEGVANLILDLQDELAAQKKEKDRLAALQKRTESRIDGLRSLLTYVCNGEKFNGTTVKVGFRRSQAVEINDPSKVILWATNEGHEEVLKYADPTISKSALKPYLDMGIEVPGAVQTETVSAIIR